MTAEHAFPRGGYAGKILDVDLTKRTSARDALPYIRLSRWEGVGRSHRVG
jgi:hypothetical protein